MRKKDENAIWVRLYGEGDKEHRPKMSKAKKGQMVRISKSETSFRKGLHPELEGLILPGPDRQVQPTTGIKVNRQSRRGAERFLVSRRSARNRKESIPYREGDPETNNRQRRTVGSRQGEGLAIEIQYVDPRIRSRAR